MSTDITKRRLITKGLQTRRLGGAIPQWEVFSPERGYSLGKFGMDEGKQKRIAEKALAARQKAQYAFNTNRNFYKYSTHSEDGGVGGKAVPIASKHFVKSSHGKPIGDPGRIERYLYRLHDIIDSAKKEGVYQAMAPHDMYRLTGIPSDRNGAHTFLQTILAAAENPSTALNNPTIKKSISNSFERWHRGQNLDEDLHKPEITSLWNTSQLANAQKEYLTDPSTAKAQGIVDHIEKMKEQINAEAEAKDKKLRYDKWEKKHGDTAEEGYVEGLLGQDYSAPDNPYYQQAQKERADQSLDEYLAAGKGTLSQKKKAKHKNPDLYEAGFPEGQQTEIPERKFIEEPELNISDIEKPKKPDFRLILDSNKRKEEQQSYDKELDDYEHAVTSRMREADMAAQWNDKIIARNKALKKERQQLIAENTFEDNLKMQRKLLKDKRKEYEKAKNEKSRDKRVLGAHDFWNVVRGNTSSTPDSVGSIGGITSSLAAANQAIQKGPQNLRRI
ncbi:hypothetical protein [Candidatus Endomicrobiellum devescovinae]|jgi:hypothetical protein|uniref:hypothetical protein n=1 Tax=Candidatus Endomicrobiellum devescovinae TaxID=3242322 RepID=UPI00281ECCA0|nr:hypothetical protein [Endomicrobium sp.]